MAEQTKKKDIQARIDKFTWYSKQELYEYFQGMYHIDKDQVDKEVDEALKSFKLRKGKPIDPKELWQKVGSTIERKLSRKNEATQVYRISTMIDDHNEKQENEGE